MIPADVVAELQHSGALMNPDELPALAARAAQVPADQEIVEIGSWAGGSAAWLCAGSRYGAGAHITCVDTWADWIDPPADQHPSLGADAFARFSELVDWTRLTALRAPSLQVAPMWTKPIGMLFIDGSHTFEDCRADYEAWSPHVVAGGVLAVHDFIAAQPSVQCWWTEGPTRAVQEVVVASGLWTDVEVVDCLWTARRV